MCSIIIDIVSETHGHAMSDAHIRSKKKLSFDQLMRLGQAALAEGDRRTAHDTWRRAAMLEPDNERVWVALLKVLDSEADKRVCLMNILTINPQNANAQAMLDQLIGDTQPQPEPVRRRPRTPSIRTTAEFEALDAQRATSIDYTRVIVLSLILGVGTATGMILLRLLLT